MTGAVQAAAGSVAAAMQQDVVVTTGQTVGPVIGYSDGQGIGSRSPTTFKGVTVLQLANFSATQFSVQLIGSSLPPQDTFQRIAVETDAGTYTTLLSEDASYADLGANVAQWVWFPGSVWGSSGVNRRVRFFK